MPNLTLSMPDDVHRRMKQHPEIRWTHVMRQAVIDRLGRLERERPPERRMRGYPTMYRIKNNVFREAPEIAPPDWDKLDG